MKILLISNMYPSEEQVFFGSFIKNIEEGLLLNDGVQVDKIVIKGKGKGFYEKIKKYFIFYKKILNINLQQYDIIHVSYPSHTYLPLIFKHKDKLVIRLHGLDLVSDTEEQFFTKYLRFFTKLAISNAKSCVVPSKYFKRELQKFDKNNKVKEIYVYPSGGISLEKFHPLASNPNEIFTIGYVGRIDQLKGVDILIEAFSQIKIVAKLIIIGEGELLENMKLKASKSSKKNFIEFTGAIANECLIDYYNMFDIFIFPTMRKGESFGNVAIESMACGTPIIGSKMAGLEDYIYNGKNGYFFIPGDVNDLAEKIQKFYNLDSFKKNSMSNHALEVAKSYERRLMSRNFYEYLQTIN